MYVTEIYTVLPRDALAIVSRPSVCPSVRDVDVSWGHRLY